MSKKTNFKRIALVAVTSLGFGVLTSVAPANAAGTLTVRGDMSYAASTSLGICSAVVNNASDALQVGEVLVGGKVGFSGSNTDMDAGDVTTFTVSGPGTIGSVTPGTTTLTYTGLTKLTATSAGGNETLPTALVVNATGAGVIQLTIAAKLSGGTSATIEIYTITASTTCTTQAFSAANSLMRISYYANIASAANNTTDATAATTSGTQTLAASADRVANGGTAYVVATVKDGSAAKSTLTSAGIFGATATNGAVVSWAGDSTLQSSSAFEEATGSNALSVYQGDANEDKPMSTVVTVTYNGAVLGTRTINFTGKPTAIAINPALSGTGKKSAASSIIGAYEITDAAGNKLTTEGAGVTGASSSGDVNSAVLADTTKKLADSVTQTVVANSDYTVYTVAQGYAGKFNWTCGVTSGSAQIYLTYTFSNLTKLTSPAYDARCGNTPVNYKASLDKASYFPGEIATLTISATDSKGQLPFDVDGSGAGNDLGSSASPLSISLPALTAVTAPTNTDEFLTGKKSYKYTVGTTEGSFSGVVDLPLYNGTTYAQVAQTVSYKVAASTTAVSNADVLKSIVALIASINKQIQALQKLILKR